MPPDPHRPGPPLRSELRTLASLAWPTSLGLLSFMAMNVVDTICVGQISSQALAGVAAANAWGLSGGVFALGAVRAIEPIVAQAYGEGDRVAGGNALLRMLVLSVPLGLLTGLWYLLAVPGLRMLGQPEAVLPAAEAYATAFAISWVPSLLVHTLRTFLQALGEVRPAMIVTVGGALLKAPLNLLLMNGAGPIPAMGITGVAIATTIIEVAMLGALAWLARDTLRSYWPAAPDLSLAPLLRLLGLGAPLGVQMGTEFWAFAGLQMMMGWIGEGAMAAHQAAINLASVSFMIPLGISTAAAARVGHRFGAGEDWGIAAKAALVLGVGTQIASGAVFAIFGPWLVQPYTTDPEVRLVAASLLPIAAAFQLFDGIQVISFGILRGAGDIRLPTAANLVGYYIFGLPLGYWLGIALGHGPRGLWYGISLGLAIVAVSLMLRIRFVHRRGGTRLR